MALQHVEQNTRDRFEKKLLNTSQRELNMHGVKLTSSHSCETKRRNNKPKPTFALL